MKSLDELLAAEAIRNLKAIYCYALDTKDWPRIAALYTDDAVFDARGERSVSDGKAIQDLPSLQEAVATGDPLVPVGGQAIAAMIEAACKNWITVHHAHTPIIEITSPVTAEAIWPMSDYIDDGEHSLKGYGHYHERYRKVDDRWLVCYATLTRIWVDGSHPWQNDKNAIAHP